MALSILNESAMSNISRITILYSPIKTIDSLTLLDITASDR